MPLILATVTTVASGEVIEAGRTAEVSERDAGILVRLGRAELADAQEPRAPESKRGRR